MATPARGMEQVAIFFLSPSPGRGVSVTTPTRRCDVPHRPFMAPGDARPQGARALPYEYSDKANPSAASSRARPWRTGTTSS